MTHPLLLYRGKHIIPSKIVHDSHNRVMHGDVTSTLTELRATLQVKVILQVRHMSKTGKKAISSSTTTATSRVQNERGASIHPWWSRFRKPLLRQGRFEPSTELINLPLHLFVPSLTASAFLRNLKTIDRPPSKPVNDDIWWWENFQGGRTRNHKGYEKLLAAIVEVKMILNCRHLSYVSTEKPFTQSQLLCGRRLSLPDSNTSDTPDFDSYIQPHDRRKGMKHLSNALSHFWQMSTWSNCEMPIVTLVITTLAEQYPLKI